MPVLCDLPGRRVKSLEDLHINCKGEENDCCVLGVWNYNEFYAGLNVSHGVMCRHITSRINTTVSPNTLYCCSAVDLYSDGADRNTEYHVGFYSLWVPQMEFRHSASVRSRRRHWNFFLLPHYQSTQHWTLYGLRDWERRWEIWKGENNVGRKKCISYVRLLSWD